MEVGGNHSSARWQPGERAPSTRRTMKKYVGITACPTGIAHTYMAAEKLEETAKETGNQIKVETQGSIGVENLSLIHI